MSNPASDTAERGNRAKERTETGRSRRIPMGVPQAKLGIAQKPGYVRRWVNDWPGRLLRAQQAGYEFVADATSKDEDGRMKRHVGTHPDGSPLFAYAMEIREEFYKEDQLAKEASLKEVDAAIRRGVPQGDQAGGFEGKSYVPSEGIKLET